MRVISPQHVLLTSGTMVRFNNVGITGTKSLLPSLPPSLTLPPTLPPSLPLSPSLPPSYPPSLSPSRFPLPFLPPSLALPPSLLPLTLPPSLPSSYPPSSFASSTCDSIPLNYFYLSSLVSGFYSRLSLLIVRGVFDCYSSFSS